MPVRGGTYILLRMESLNWVIWLVLESLFLTLFSYFPFFLLPSPPFFPFSVCLGKMWERGVVDALISAAGGPVGWNLASNDLTTSCHIPVDPAPLHGIAGRLPPPPPALCWVARLCDGGKRGRLGTYCWRGCPFFFVSGSLDMCPLGPLFPVRSFWSLPCRLITLTPDVGSVELLLSSGAWF